MRISRYLACALVAAGAARAEDAPAPLPKPAAVAINAPPPAAKPQGPEVEQAMTELPAIGNDPAVRVALRGTPASLPPVTAQIFRIGGRTEVSPFFQMSVGDPFYKTWLAGVRVEHHLDERWSLGNYGGLAVCVFHEQRKRCQGFGALSVQGVVEDSERCRLGRP